MRQAILEGPRRLAFSDAPEPAPSIGELLIEVRATAICGTDVHIYTGETPVAYPRVLGHEASGVVRDAGEGVAGFEPGDSVVINPNLNCGRCERCVLGKENICASVELMGREVEGVLREYITVPQDHAFELPSGVSFEEGALMQPLSTVMHAHRLAEISNTESVVVLGLGTTGLMHAQLSKLAGAYPLIGIGRSPWKLDLALKLGADIVVSAAEQSPVEEVLDFTGGGADVVIECVGAPWSVAQAVKMTKPGGRAIGFGISPHPLSSLDLYDMYLREMSLAFPRATTQADFHRTVSVVASGRLALKPFITCEYPLEDAASAFEFAEKERSRALRLVIKP